jgi:hypothetical protein
MDQMKKLIVIILLTCSYCLCAQGNKKMVESGQDSVYCLSVKDGMPVLTSSTGRVVTGEVTLSNGARLNTKGIITKKDGTQIMMKDGDCTNTLGEPMHGNNEAYKNKK